MHDFPIAFHPLFISPNVFISEFFYLYIPTISPICSVKS